MNVVGLYDGQYSYLLHFDEAFNNDDDDDNNNNNNNNKPQYDIKM